MLWKLGIFFVTIGIAKLIYYFTVKRRKKNDDRAS